MQSDEAQIRELVQTWMSATRDGDVERILDLMADDAVFLVPGRAPMRKPEFAAQAKSQAAPGAPTIEGSSEIQEIQVAGDWAFMWTRLSVTVRPAGGAPGQPARSGHTLTVLRKQDGRWRLARDANLLSPGAGSPPAVELDHSIVPSHHPVESARRLAELLDVPWAESGVGPFSPVYVNGGLTLDFIGTDEAFPIYHFCFRVDDARFDAILARLKAAAIPYRGAVRGPMDMQINTDYGGRLVYWNEPDGHQWEMLTVSYARQP